MLIANSKLLGAVIEPKNKLTMKFFKEESENFKQDYIVSPVEEMIRGLEIDELIYILSTPDDEIDFGKYLRIIKKKCEFEGIKLPNYIAKLKNK